MIQTVARRGRIVAARNARMSRVRIRFKSTCLSQVHEPEWSAFDDVDRQGVFRTPAEDVHQYSWKRRRIVRIIGGTPVFHLVSERDPEWPVSRQDSNGNYKRLQAELFRRYFAPYNHNPTSTNVAVLERSEPRRLIEIQMVAVVD